jgi:hypothetical protein
MLLQAAGLALLAALSPAALLITAVYLGSAQPRRTSTFYLAGAVLMSTILAVAGLVVLRTAGLSRPDHHASRYGLRLGLGLLLVVVGFAVIARRRRRRDQPRKQRQGLVSRMVASPSPRSAFIVGILVFAPGVTFLAALQVVATAKASVELTVVAVALIVLLDALLVWLPLLFHLIAPGMTEHRLKAFNGWLRAHSGPLLVGVIFVVGAIMIIDGSSGLIAGK